MDLVKLLRAQWDRALAVAAVIGGVVALILGYRGISGTPFTAEQLPYIISGGITGLFLIGLAATLYLSADLRDEWRKMDELDEHLVQLIELQQKAPETAAPVETNGSNRAAARRAAKVGRG